jgi:integrase
VGEWLNTWLQQYKRSKIRVVTYDTYEMIINRHLKPALGHITLRELRPEHIQAYQNAKTLNAATIRAHHRLLSGALTQAEKNQLVVRNVCRLVDLPRQPRRETNTLTMEQFTGQLLPALQNDRLYAAYLTLFMTGLRRGELLGLRWKDIDLTAGELHVRQTVVRVKEKLMFSEPKTDKSVERFRSLKLVLRP